jgi:hypothetical protein
MMNVYLGLGDQEAVSRSFHTVTSSSRDANVLSCKVLQLEFLARNSIRSVSHRYRNYLPQLQPIIPILHQAMDWLGYTV